MFGPGDAFPFAPERKYTPCDASRDQLWALRERLGFSRSVVVQATCHGADNRALTDALEHSDGTARGVATVRSDVTDEELHALHAAGVRGVRFNFVKRLVDALPHGELESIAARIAPLGWHTVIYFEAPDLAEHRGFFTSLPTPVVFDHMGRPDLSKPADGPEFDAFAALLAEHDTMWTKVTCPERLSLTGPPTYDDFVPFAPAPGRGVPGARAVGHRLAAPEPEEPHARRRDARGHDPAHRADRGAATQAADRQSDESLLEGLLVTNVVLAGAGAFGIKHLDGIRNIDGVEVTGLVGRRMEPTRDVAGRYGIGNVATELSEALTWPDVDAVILCTPTQMHADQAIACMEAGKHVEVEIPLADSLADARRVAEVQKATGLVCMVGHTRRFNPSHQWVNRRLRAGELTIQQMDVQTFFFRRKNMNALGEPRSWTDHLLWHHAAHTVDLFQYQTGERVTVANAVQGPIHPELGIAMDLSIQLKTDGRGDLHAVAVVQQRRPARHLLPLHRRHRHLHRALRRSRGRQARSRSTSRTSTCR